MRWTSLALVALVMLLAPQSASAVSPVDPPLTYILTVYDREPGRLAPDGTTVIVTRGGRERERLGLPPGGPCGQAKVVDGRAELRVETTPDCPEGMFVSLVILDLPGGGITASSDPPIEWRRAYSESTMSNRSLVMPIAPRT